jgi:hypothetical protein
MYVMYDIKEPPTSEAHFSTSILLQYPLIIAHFVFRVQYTDVRAMHRTGSWIIFMAPFPSVVYNVNYES